LAYYSTLEIQGKFSSETSAWLWADARRCIQDNWIFQIPIIISTMNQEKEWQSIRYL
jgi:hypothetical protein